MEYNNNKRNGFVVWGISGIVFIIILTWASIQFDGNEFLCFSSICLWMVVTMPVFITGIDWIHPLFIQMLFEIPKTLSLATRASGYIPVDFRWRISVINDDIVNSYIKCVILTCIGLVIEYLIVIYFRVPFRTRAIKIKKSDSGAILGVVSLMSFVLLIEQLGGFRHVIVHYRDRLSEFSGDTNLYLRYLIAFGAIACFVFYLDNKNTCFIIMAILQVFMYITLGERGGIITMFLLPFVTLFQLKHNRRIKLYQAMLIGCFGIASYLIIGVFRDAISAVPTAIAAGSGLNKFIYKSVTAVSDVEHFVISSELVYLIDNNKISLQYGRPLLNIFFAAFPRKLFPMKPTYIAESALAGSLILNRNHNVFGMPPGNFVYGYMNFGIAGVVLFSVINGLFSKWLYSSFVKGYWCNKKSIPDGNALLYALLLSSIYSVVSTEVQIKMIVSLVGFWIVWRGVTVGNDKTKTMGYYSNRNKKS